MALSLMDQHKLGIFNDNPGRSSIPASRGVFSSHIQKLRKAGPTVLITLLYINQTQRLYDGVTIVSSRPESLIREVQADSHCGCRLKRPEKIDESRLELHRKKLRSLTRSHLQDRPADYKLDDG